MDIKFVATGAYTVYLNGKKGRTYNYLEDAMIDITKRWVDSVEMNADIINAETGEVLIQFRDDEEIDHPEWTS